MFRAQSGFLAAFFLGEGASRVVLTLWSDDAAAKSLASSPTYQETVRAIEASGILLGEPALHVVKVTPGTAYDQSISTGISLALADDRHHESV